MTQTPLKMLFLSNVDYRLSFAGGSTYTRNFLHLVDHAGIGATVDYVAVTAGFGRLRRLRQLWSFVEALPSPLPSKAHYFKSHRFLQHVRAKLAARRYSLIVIDHAELLWVLPELPPEVPKILIAHNLEYKLQSTRIGMDNRFARLTGQVLRHDLDKFKRFEEDGARAVGNVIALSSDEGGFFSSLGPDLRVLHLLPVFSYEAFDRAGRRPADGPIEIGFLGNFRWWPNADGLLWLKSEVLPRLGTSVVLHVFGQGAEGLVQGRPEVRVHGFVGDLRSVWATSDFTVAPIFKGGGVNIKVAESLFNRTPVLVTGVAARGLDLPEDRTIIRLDTAEDWVGFLKSDAARALRTACVPQSVSDRFSAARQAPVLADFIGKVLGDKNA